ncbi:hypothetical protein KI387_031482, partial [Taxus chinensis]
DQKHKCMLKSARKAGKALDLCVRSFKITFWKTRNRTAALLRAAVTGPPPCSGRRSQDRRPGRAAGF